ncbi:hypothetical protein Anamo_1214 [Acetomicrobium mobile DSM 13181]|uniref:Uncharacterized protein n=1 Tax=Acetomicrobium mobile (strain ATCC BAA-54 / DSM 13181 / JCM 12221 / NGA) TaxID=891968 RepID=I4BX25_ACEMN|nr:hypothetical protein Anamo_1214 [Acetomicrobium mobile DSM 13181]
MSWFMTALDNMYVRKGLVPKRQLKSKVASLKTVGRIVTRFMGNCL